MSQATNVVEVTDANFEQQVIQESKKRPVVVDLWADWCGPCKILGPVLERAAEEQDGKFLLAKLDVDANQMTAAQFGVQSIPTVVAFKDGQPVDGFVGALPEPNVKQWISGLLPTEADEAAMIFGRPIRDAASTTWNVPSTRTSIASAGFSAHCVIRSAAWWNTTSMPSISRSRSPRSRMSPITTATLP